MHICVCVCQSQAGENKHQKECVSACVCMLVPQCLSMCVFEMEIEGADGIHSGTRGHRCEERKCIFSFSQGGGWVLRQLELEDAGGAAERAFKQQTWQVKSGLIWLCYNFMAVWTKWAMFLRSLVEDFICASWSNVERKKDSSGELLCMHIIFTMITQAPSSARTGQYFKEILPFERQSKRCVIWNDYYYV